MTFVKNELRDMPVPVITGGVSGQGLTGAFVQTIKDGYPLYAYELNQFKGYKANGESEYINPDGSIVDSGNAKKVLTDKTPLPKMTVGFSTSVSYKQFDFSADIYTVQGVTRDNLFLYDYVRGGSLRGVKNGIKQETSKTDHHIFIKSDKKMIKILMEEILFIEGMKEYIKVVTADKSYITLKSLASLSEELPIDKFIRIHKSFIIAIDKIKSIEGNRIQILTHKLPIGRNYGKDVKNKILNT